MECECCRRESVVLRFTTHWCLLWVPKGSLARRWGRLGVQHRRFPFAVASPDSLRPQRHVTGKHHVVGYRHKDELSEIVQRLLKRVALEEKFFVLVERRWGARSREGRLAG